MYKININRRNQSFIVKRVDKSIRISTVNRRVNIIGSSKRGLPGKDGIGIPSGGTPGEVLVKTVDGTAWQSFEGTDKYFEQPFSATDNISVTHNLNKYPAVTIHDSAGDEVEGDVVHQNSNQFLVTFSAPFSGVVTCS